MTTMTTTTRAEDGEDDGNIEYVIMIRHANKHNKIVAHTRVGFTVQPFAITRVQRNADDDQWKDVMGKGLVTSNRPDKSDADLATDLLNSIKDWVFKRHPTPFGGVVLLLGQGDDNTWLWDVAPAQFTPADQRAIKRQYLFEEI